LSAIQVQITKGHYRGKEISGTFHLIKGYVEGARGGYVTIRNPNPDPGTPPVQRIQVEKDHFKLVDATGADLPAHVVVPGQEKLDDSATDSTDYERLFMETETEDEAMERIRETFLMLDRIADAVARGVVRGLVVSGPPGIGKSFGVEKQLEAANMFLTMKGQNPKYEIVTGGVSSLGLYQKLYYNRHPGQVLVFDDCDGVLFEEESLSLLKGALNSGDKRRICWNKESKVLQGMDIDSQFDFEGGIMFLSNIDFERTIARGSRISAHLEAIMSRCHYLDLEITSTRDKILRIKQVISDGMFNNYAFENGEEKMIQNFIIDNQEYLRELSLRQAKKIADFVKADPKHWLEMAEATCLTKEAKFKRLLEKKKAEAARRGVDVQA